MQCSDTQLQYKTLSYVQMLDIVLHLTSPNSSTPILTDLGFSETCCTTTIDGHELVATHTGTASEAALWTPHPHTAAMFTTLMVDEDRRQSSSHSR